MTSGSGKTASAGDSMSGAQKKASKLTHLIETVSGVFPLNRRRILMAIYGNCVPSIEMNVLA
jgi:hypothetical protein